MQNEKRKQFEYFNYAGQAVRICVDDEGFADYAETYDAASQSFTINNALLPDIYDSVQAQELDEDAFNTLLAKLAQTA